MRERTLSTSLLIALILLAVALGHAEPGRAQEAGDELPAEPVLRIETGLHVGKIRRIDTDAGNRFAVTASDDKTVRVWSLPDGRLLRILRLPLGAGDTGKAYAVAISPDASTVAVGGWTANGERENIFLFDRASGELTKRLKDLPAVIFHLAYSPDGRRLAASLGNNGIRVFDAGDGYQPLPSDTQYKDESDWVSFDRTGRLVTTADDGFVRLYAADHYQTPIARFRLKGNRPYSAAFSPDGARVAIGFYDHPKVTVLSGSKLTKLFEADTTGIDDEVGSVGWSQDGRFLFAGGDWPKDDTSLVRRWSEGGRGTFVDIPFRSDTVLEFVGLQSGSILSVANDGFGLIGVDSKVTPLQGFGALDLSSNHEFRVSADGGIVQIDSVQPSHIYRFALADRRVDVDPPADPALLSPVTQAPGLKVRNWDGSTAPTVNGAPVNLDQNERAQSLAIMPGAQRFLVGADWSLRLLDRKGHEVWPAALAVPDIAWHVNATADGRLAVVAYGDGTIRWHRISDGEELLALFIHSDGRRWIAWTPQGYYDASLGADNLIGWHVNHGYDQAPDFYPVSQFRDRFYRPDVISRVLRTANLDVEEAVHAANDAAGRPMAKAIPVSSLLTPKIQIKYPQEGAGMDQVELRLGYLVRLPSADDSLRLEVQVDGVKVKFEDHPLMDASDTRAGDVQLTIPRRDSKVSVIAYNGNGAGEPASVHVQWRGPGTEPKLTLYVLAIGISNYKDEKVNLRFAAKDADDFIAAARQQEGGLYEKVITHPPHGSLRDSEATKEAILDELDWIKLAVTNTNDVAMVFLSGHGMTTPDQHYRFLPYDYNSDHVERTTISDSELKDYLTKIGGKKIFFFDTCYSGAVLPGSKAVTTQANVDKFANELKAAENGVVVFTSSTGNELSQERDEWHNGAFTKAVVEGLHGAAARPDVPVITISDLNGYVSRIVKDLTGGNQRPMLGMPITAVEDFPIAERVP